MGLVRHLSIICQPTTSFLLPLTPPPQSTLSRPPGFHHHHQLGLLHRPCVCPVGSASCRSADLPTVTCACPALSVFLADQLAPAPCAASANLYQVSIRPAHPLRHPNRHWAITQVLEHSVRRSIERPLSALTGPFGFSIVVARSQQSIDWQLLPPVNHQNYVDLPPHDTK